MKVVSIIRKSFKLVLPALLVVGAGMVCSWAGYNLLSPMTLPVQGVDYRVPEGAGLASLAHDLASDGLLSSGRWLTLYGRLTDAQGAIKAGEYRLSRGMTPLQFLRKVRDGEVIQRQVTLLEGWSFQQTLEALHKQSEIDHQLTGLNVTEIMTRLQRPGENPEGRFFPDTYNYERGTSDISILAAAYERMTEILSEEWLLRAPGLPLETPYEALILASIVEKESGLNTDRSRIAGVFVGRLIKRMRLQSDPTVIYGMGADFSGDLRKADLTKSTPYNTYVHYGLPPTPISNSSRAAIHAALNPANVSSLYFVARGDGTSQFSDTLEEHNRAVRKYQLGGQRPNRARRDLPDSKGNPKVKLNPDLEPVVE
jgi:UPF0755 protein